MIEDFIFMFLYTLMNYDVKCKNIVCTHSRFFLTSM